MRKAIAIWLLSLAGFMAHAQPPANLLLPTGHSSFHLSGRITDSAGSPLSFATVQFITTGDTLVAVTSDNGSFIFSRLTARTFRLDLTMKGYLPTSRAFTIEEGKTTLQLPPFILQTNYMDLDPVTVNRPRPITIIGDTVSYNTAAFPVRDGAEVEDILKKLPGIEVDIDGNIIVQGKKVSKVTVNGKDFFGGDVLLAIRNLPADIVSKLQIIDDYGDRARLTGVKVDPSVKKLNIVIKPDKRTGLFGNVTGELGTKDKYDIDGMGNSFHDDRQVSITGGTMNNSETGKNQSRNLALNYTDLWNRQWSGAINTEIRTENQKGFSGMSQTSYYPGQQYSQQQSSTTTNHSDGYSAGAVLSYRPAANTMMRITPRVGYLESSQQAATNFSTMQQDSGFVKTTVGTTDSRMNNSIKNAKLDLYFERTAPQSRRRYSIQANGDWSNSLTLSDNQTKTDFYTGVVPGSGMQHLITSNSMANLNFGISGNYWQPVNNNSFLELGYVAHSATSNNNRSTKAPDTLTQILASIDSLSFSGLYHSRVQQLHAGYIAKLDHLNISLSLNGEQGSLSGDVDNKGHTYAYEYLLLLPQAQANWQLSPKQNISAQIQSSSIVPGLNQVSPVPDLTNPQYPILGNPNLKPSETYASSFQYTKINLRPAHFTSYGIGFSYSITVQPIVSSVFHPRDTSQVIQSTTYANIGQSNSQNLTWFYNSPTVLGKRLRITTNGGLTRNSGLSLVDGMRFYTQNLAFNEALHFQLLIPDVIESNLQTNYMISGTRYSSPSQLPALVQSVAVAMNVKHYILPRWSQSYIFSQLYISSGRGLQAQPASLTASIQHEFLRHNKGTITLTGNNLLNSGALASQSVTSSTITRSQIDYIGRYFILAITVKLQRFHD